jgi:hypothetical protein
VVLPIYAPETLCASLSVLVTCTPVILSSIFFAGHIENNRIKFVSRSERRYRFVVGLNGRRYHLALRVKWREGVRFLAKAIDKPISWVSHTDTE